jgi:uncharacterized protein YbjT (DUF2867 family)
MDVVIAGAHGQIALRLARLLADRGSRVRGLIRNPAHAGEVTTAGAEPIVCDLETADVDLLADAIAGAEALVFAAGAGPGSGAERKATMDLGGASKTIAAALRTGVERYVMISSMGAADPPAEGGDVFGAYLRAKAAADRELAASGLRFTIIRPGRLTNDPGSGRVHAGPSEPRGSIARDDVAAVAAAVLAEPRTAGVTFELVGGETPIADAVAALV